MNKYELIQENEFYYLGCILKDPSLLEEGKLKLEHFNHPYSKGVYLAIEELKKRK